MTYVIGKTFGFEAAHHLPDLPEGHKCRRPHGHSYTVTVVLEADGLDMQSMVADYAVLSPIREWIKDTLDHHDLNDLLNQPTAEALAEYIHGYWAVDFPALAEVTVRETAATFATYRPDRLADGAEFAGRVIVADPSS